jgi:hypothetical protein
MRILNACVVAAVALLPLTEAVPASAGVSVGVSIGGPVRGHYYYGHRYYPYRWNGGYYNYFWGGHYYKYRYVCGPHHGWCYR